MFIQLARKIWSPGLSVPQSDAKSVLTQEGQNQITVANITQQRPNQTQPKMCCSHGLRVKALTPIHMYSNAWIKTSFFPTTHPFVFKYQGPAHDPHTGNIAITNAKE